MSDDEPDQTAREWVRSRVDDLTEPEPDGIQHQSSNIWTSVDWMRNAGRKSSIPFDRDELEEAVTQLGVEGELLTWHGLVAPTADDHLVAVIENERKADVTRTTLVAKANRMRSQEVRV